jgi:large subunit ribosomal protein L7/L12
MENKKTEKNETISGMESEHVEKILTTIENLSVGDLIKLTESLQKKFGISPEMMNMGGGASAAVQATEAPAEDVNKKVSIYLKELGTASALQYIKAAKEVFGSTIEVAKGHTTKVSAGEVVIIKDALSKKEAEELVAKLKTSAPGLGLEIK